MHRIVKLDINARLSHTACRLYFPDFVWPCIVHSRMWVLTSCIKWLIMLSDVFLCVIFILWSSLPCCISTMLLDMCSLKSNVKVFAWSKGAVIIGWDTSHLVLCNSLLMPPKLHFIKIWQSSVILRNWSTARQGQFWMFRQMQWCADK